MNFQRGQDKEPLEINLVPMIDVMLVILIFLMVTTTYSKYTELQINLPSAQAERQLDRPNEVAVLVNAQGQYVINRLPVPYRSVDQLAGELRRSEGEWGAAFARYERLLRPLIAEKQRAAVRFASSFAPRTRLGIAVRNLVTRAFAIGPIADLFVGRTLRDEIQLPGY